MGQGMGLALGMILSGFIADHLGWRWVFFLYAFPSLAAGLLILHYIREPQNLQPPRVLDPGSTFSFDTFSLPGISGSSICPVLAMVMPLDSWGAGRPPFLWKRV